MWGHPCERLFSGCMRLPHCLPPGLAAPRGGMDGASFRYRAGRWRAEGAEPALCHLGGGSCLAFT